MHARKSIPCFLSSVGQLIQLHTLNSSTIVGHDNDTRNSNICGPVYYLGHSILYGTNPGKMKTIVLSSILGSAAATAAMTAVAYFYYNSRQRRWKKEQDRLTKIMRSLPGVPT